ncbi:MAG TPA: DNA methyltransferase, partial [Candidatus Nanoarchaeia archaeon]|nr:DNA methyltransferase [Candidatus Nanoarchaeia archaeon]
PTLMRDLIRSLIRVGGFGDKVANQEGLKQQITIKQDARNLDKIPEVISHEFDLILTDPPYANMLSKKRTGGDRKDKGNFTEDERDLGNIGYEEFFGEFEIIIKKSLKFLKNRGYLVVFCKDMQPSKNHHNLLHADIVSSLSKIDGLQFKGYKIWYDKTLNLYPYGYPFSFVANQLHQYILIFRKEEDDSKKNI